MFNLDEFMGILESVCPLSLSHKMIEKGSYDNSGLLVKSSEKVEKILFSLDLSLDAVKEAVQLNCDTIVTHHPAIYEPLKSLSITGETAPIMLAVKNQINVISMHLNLDIADEGIDQLLCKGLGGENIEILDFVDEKNGYGRQASIKETTLNEFAVKIKQTFTSDKIIFYGNKVVKKIASFCGSGASQAIECLDRLTADTVVSSDIPHHHLKTLIENGKNVVIIPHYVSEQYGFNSFYALLTEKLHGKAQTFYFLDKRFM